MVPCARHGVAVGARRGGASTSTSTGRRAQLFSAGERGHAVARALLRGHSGLCAGARDGLVQRPAPWPQRDAGRAAVS
jgi:hypothetical protein